MKKIVLYSMQKCPHCVSAKRLLVLREIGYEEIILAEDDGEAWEKLYKVSPMKTVPQIFINDKLLGGYPELRELDEKDHLQSLKKTF